MLFPVWLQIPHQKWDAFGRLVVVTTLSAGLGSLPAQAESGEYVPYSGIIHGTDGADPVEVRIANATGGTVECEAALAHWYSDDLGQIAPGDELTLTLWHDRETGVLNLMNATDDRMPVEAVWCSNETARSRLTLPIASGKAEATLRYSCHPGGEAGLSCEAAGG